jgi:hypothetical protein
MGIERGDRAGSSSKMTVAIKIDIQIPMGRSGLGMGVLGKRRKEEKGEIILRKWREREGESQL